jgi:serine/threonine protein kinase
LGVTLPAQRHTQAGPVSEKVVNLSASGLALATATRLIPGAVERVTVVSPDPNVKVTVEAEVMRVHSAASEGGYVAGMRFTTLDAQAVAALSKLMLAALKVPSGKRASPRLEVTTEVFWASAGYPGTSPLELVNVSHTGALLKGPSLPAPKVRGLLSLRPEETGDLVTVPAEIVWRRGQDDDTLAGVRFGADPQAAELVGRIIRALLLTKGPGGGTAPAPATGTRIGGFQLGPLLFRGRALEVYRATPADASAQTAGAAEVALKRFHGLPDEVAEWTERFLAATRAGAHLHHHPGIVRVYSAMADTTECWLVAELVKGKSLEEVLAESAREGALPPVTSMLSIAQQVLTTLEDCHHYILTGDGGHLEVLHGDLRPGNVFVTEGGAVKLSGFGAAFQGTAERLPYLPPEVLAGAAPTPQSDVYQAGVLLYELLTGVLPFSGDSARRLLTSIEHGATPPSKLNPAVPAQWDAAVLAALAVSPDARPSGAGAFAETLMHLELAASNAKAAQRRGAAGKPAAEVTNKVRALGATGPQPTVLAEQEPAPTMQVPAHKEIGQEVPPTLLARAPVPLQTIPGGTAPYERVTDPRMDAVEISEEPPLEKTTDPGGFKRGQKVEAWAPARLTLARGDTLGRYEILGKLAEGGMAQLYLARSPKGEGPLCIKTILPERAEEHDVVTMFMTEARLASQIQHPNVVRISDVGFDQGSPFIVMEYFAGRTLIDVMLSLAKLHRSMPAPIAARIIHDCCLGLDHAHMLKDARGQPLHIVHRDVTSKNVQIGYSGEVKLLDFGIARAQGVSQLTRPGHVRGTAAYVSPEQISGGRVSAATDVWALGVNLYLMLTGAMPFGGKSDIDVLMAVKDKQAQDPKLLRPDAPDPLCTAALRALMKSPADRYVSAAAMAAEVSQTRLATAHEVQAFVDELFPKTDLERMRVQQMVQPPAPPPVEEEPPPASKVGPWLLAAGAALFVAGAGAVLLWLYGR